MNDFNIQINIEDCVCEKCCKNCIQKDILITNLGQTICLQCDFILNIIAVTANSFTILIQNGIQTIIRRIFTSHPTQICIPSKCVKHVVTISGTIIPRCPTGCPSCNG